MNIGTYEDWRRIKSSWGLILDSLRESGIPAMGMTNGFPEFKADYTPNWDEVMTVVNHVVKGEAITPKPKPKVRKKK